LSQIHFYEPLLALVEERSVLFAVRVNAIVYARHGRELIFIIAQLLFFRVIRHMEQNQQSIESLKATLTLL